MFNRKMVFVGATLVLVAGVAFFVMQTRSTIAAATVLGADVTIDELAGDGPPKLRFARYVDARLSEHLAEELEIDQGDDAILDFVEREAPGQFTDEVLSTDQIVAAEMVEALTDVVVHGVDSETAFAEHGMERRMDLDRWLEVVSAASEQSIDVLRQFSESTSDLSSGLNPANFRWLYLTRSFRYEICKNVDRGDLSEGEFEFQCTISVNQHIRNSVRKNVRVNQAALEGFELELQLIDHHAEKMQAQSNL